MEGSVVKELLLNRLVELLDEKIEAAQQAIESAKESRNSDTKSSAGDKYETGRAMMQFEVDKNEVQLNKSMYLKNELSKINVSKIFHKADFGSIVETNQGNYFLSIGIGKMEVNKINCFSISLASPIGQLLLHKKVGESIHFQGKELIIESII